MHFSATSLYILPPAGEVDERHPMEKRAVFAWRWFEINEEEGWGCGLEVESVPGIS